MKEIAFKNNFLMKNFVDISSKSPQFCKTSLCPTKMCRQCGIHISLTIVFCHIYLKLFHFSQNEANCFLKWSSKFREYAISFFRIVQKTFSAHLMMCKSAYELLVFCCIFYAVCSKLANFCHLRPIVNICPQDARIDPESSCHDPPG